MKLKILLLILVAFIGSIMFGSIANGYPTTKTDSTVYNANIASSPTISPPNPAAISENSLPSSIAEIGDPVALKMIMGKPLSFNIEGTGGCLYPLIKPSDFSHTLFCEAFVKGRHG